MANGTANRGKAWTGADRAQLKALAQGNTPTRVIALKMQRTPEGVRSKASDLGVSLKPANQRPYGSRKK